MHMLRIVCCIVFAASTLACGDGGAGAGMMTWDGQVDVFATAICVCDDDPTSCEADVRQDMADAMVELDEDGQAQCMDCMGAKIVEAEKMADAECDGAVVDGQAIVAACDVDPATDYDGDGTPDNDDDEACAGAP